MTASHEDYLYEEMECGHVRRYWFSFVPQGWEEEETLGYCTLCYIDKLYRILLDYL
jgi:hypothetical protein